MSLQPRHQQTFEEWLAAERASIEGRTEYVGGEVFAMSGGTEAHNLIAATSLANCDRASRAHPVMSTPAT